MNDRISDHFLLACGLPKQHGEQFRVGKKELESLPKRSAGGWTNSLNMFVRDPFLCEIPHRQPAHPAETAMVERFQFGSVCFFQCPTSASPECYIDNNRLLEPATDIDRYLFVAQ
jgi:hypothetical protein